ncbi:DNA translocase FtsK [Vineibacter terrae]|uniref:DNA translocase FtsK n=1 Tax=Vineibacter terrae TaxID=2586908 RepID=UPI002E32B64A|nr:DNA translocase FtsK 4TM domain-containing protein [Vineibacter terrae]HEX2885787.1 DNA translocase FtsK 4TM domain-containing protein [Vineibacter terrae]
MALASLRHSASTAGRFLPSGAALFFRRRAMEIVGLAVAAIGIVALGALLTYHTTDPSLSRSTGFAPRNLFGVAGATFADLMMQSLGLGSLLVPVALGAWGLMLIRRHALPFFGLRVALLLLATLLGASAASSLDAIGHWTPHAGPGGVTGAALSARFRELTLTYSDGWLLDFLPPLTALMAVLLMVPVIGMKRGHLPIVLRVVLLPLSLVKMVLRAGIEVWRGRPEREMPADDMPEPTIGYAEVPGEIDASQYDPARFTGIPDDGQPLPPRSSLMVDAPLSPIADLKPVEPIPPTPSSLDIPPLVPREAARRPSRLAPLTELVSRLLRRQAGPSRVEPVFGQAAPPVDPQSPPEVEAAPVPPPAAAAPATEPAAQPAPGARILQMPRRQATEAAAPPPAEATAAPAAAAPKVEKRAAPQPGRRAEAERQKQLALTQEFQLPALDILAAAPRSPVAQIDEDALAQNARLLESVLEDFGVKGEIVKVRPGPVVTLYELEPAPGTKSSRVIGLADDIARSMSAVSVRVATVPGRNVIGIELPNAKREMVFLRELLGAKDYEDGRLQLPLVLGKDIGGGPVIADLARMPHLLIGGTTGSGKSVGINTMILSLLYRLPPDRCKFIMIDPKMLELSVYQDIPHLLTPVVTEPRKAVVALKWTVREMESRYRAMSQLGVRNIAGYNERVTEARNAGEEILRPVQTGVDPDTRKPIFEDQAMSLESLPFIVVIIDEMADLMMVAGKDIEIAVQRLAQMARAAGIHVIMATQRPSVDVITGTIKANFPTRISFQVTSKIDSRTILGEQGGEQLLGQGDMLYMAGGGRIVRVHGPFVSDSEVEKVVKHLRFQGQPQYLDSITEDAEGGAAGGDGEGGGGAEEGEADELYDKAIAVVARERKCSTSFIQRHLQIGYNRAARIVERMEREGVVSPANSVGKREVLARDIDGDAA